MGGDAPLAGSDSVERREMSDAMAAKRTSLKFELIDRYLLGEPVSKADVVADVLAHRSPDPMAAPFYRAFEAVGDRAADEAFAALRIIMSGAPPSDERVRRIRALSALARACRAGDAAAIAAIFRRDAAALRDLAESDRAPAALGASVRAALLQEFQT